MLIFKESLKDANPSNKTYSSEQKKIIVAYYQTDDIKGIPLFILAH